MILVAAGKLLTGQCIRLSLVDINPVSVLPSYKLEGSTMSCIWSLLVPTMMAH